MERVGATRKAWTGPEPVRKELVRYAEAKFRDCFGQGVPDKFRDAWLSTFRRLGAIERDARQLAQDFGRHAPGPARERAAEFLRKHGVDPAHPVSRPDAFLVLPPTARELALHLAENKRSRAKCGKPEATSREARPFSLREAKAVRGADRGPLVDVTEIVPSVIWVFETAPLHVGGDGWELTPGARARRYVPVGLTDQDLAAVAVVLDRQLVRLTADDLLRGITPAQMFHRAVAVVHKARKTHGHPLVGERPRRRGEHPEIPMP